MSLHAMKLVVKHDLPTDCRGRFHLDFHTDVSYTELI